MAQFRKSILLKKVQLAFVPGFVVRKNTWKHQQSSYLADNKTRWFSACKNVTNWLAILMHFMLQGSHASEVVYMNKYPELITANYPYKVFIFTGYLLLCGSVCICSSCMLCLYLQGDYFCGYLSLQHCQCMCVHSKVLSL